MRFALFGVLYVLCFLLVSCGHAQPSILAATPDPGQSPPRKFKEPTGELSFSVQPTEWAPATIGPDGAAMLTDALKNIKSIMVLTGSQMSDPVFEDRVYQMVKAASPETKIVARNHAVLDEIMLERGEIPYRQTWEVGGQDVLGRPWLLPKDHPLKTDWLEKKKLLKGAEAILIINFVKVDDQKLREMRSQVHGGCDGLLGELKRGVAHSGAWFSSLLEQVNDALATEFSRQMQTMLPFWQDELQQGMSLADPGSQDARCYGAYQKFLNRYDDCLKGRCEGAPALHVEGGGVIGMELSSAAAIPHDCPTGMGRNYVDELVTVGERVSRDVMKDIPAGWAGEFSKVDILSRLDNELADLCAPAYRRYAASDLDVARKAVETFLQQVVTTRFQGSWEPAEGTERIAGVGAVRVFGKAKPKTGEDKVWTAQLRDIFKPLNRCRDSKRRPVQIALVDVGTSEVYFSAVVFEEQLFCEDLPPQ